jgi:cysteine desulfurase/selenocysteine lyase
MTIPEARELFPHLKTGQVYFNHAAIGPWSNLVLKRVAEYSKQRSSSQIENYRFLLEWNANAKIKLGKLIGTIPERIAWVDNVSNGLNILAQGLEWKIGDRIILNDIEFPSNVYPFLNLKKLGVEIDFAKSHEGIVDVEDIEKLITSRTKLISISLVQFLSGYRADMDAIGELCRKHEIIFCVDAIQGAGVVEIDVQKSNIDFLTGGTQKWFMSSQGLSYLFITEELQKRLDQKNVGWTSVVNAWNLLDYDLTLKKNADCFQNGTVNALGVAVFEASLNLFDSVGIHNIEKEILENTKYFINRLDEINLNPILKNIKQNHRAGIVSFKHANANEIFKKLEQRKIYCAVRENMVRFSPHFYNTRDEINIVIDALESFTKG